MSKFKIPAKAATTDAPGANPAAIAAFAAGADERREIHAAPQRPWQDADNKRQGYPFSLRLTDCQKSQLDYIATHAGTRSAHAWVVGILAPILEAEAERLFEIHGGAGE